MKLEMTVAAVAVAQVMVMTAGTVTAATPPAMAPAKVGEAHPAGWFLTRAQAARDGYTGHMAEIDEHFRIAWTTNAVRNGAELFWGDRVKGGWHAEGGAYWYDGLVKLAFQLDDPYLKDLARERLDTVLSRMNPKAIGFLWWLNRDLPDDQEQAFNPFGGWHVFWVGGMAERSLAAWYEATGDERVPRAFEHAFGWREVAEQKNEAATLLSGMIDAWRITRSPAIAECIETAAEKFRRGFFAHYSVRPWSKLADTLSLKRVHTTHYGIPDRHGVAAFESLLSSLRLAQYSGDASLLKAVIAWTDFLDRNCHQAHGGTVADEEWGFAGARRGTETCTVAADMFLRENLLAATGDGKWGDDVERLFFNAGQAYVSPDFKRHVYHQFPNRLGETNDVKHASCTTYQHSRYGSSVWPLCCTASLNRILPNYIQYQWLTTADGGVAAALYGPSAFATTLKVGKVAFEERTQYPFSDTVEIVVKEAPSAAFPLKVRVPGWCASPEIAVNGTAVNAAAVKGFATIARDWKAGDVVTLRFPVAPVCAEIRDHNELSTLRRSVYLGPVLFAYLIPTDDENTPKAPVVEPVLPTTFDAAAFKVVRGELPAGWDWSVAAPLRLLTKDADGKPLELVPYASTKLRISAFKVR